MENREIKKNRRKNRNVCQVDITGTCESVCFQGSKIHICSTLSLQDLNSCCQDISYNVLIFENLVWFFWTIPGRLTLGPSSLKKYCNKILGLPRFYVTCISAANNFSCERRYVLLTDHLGWTKQIVVRHHQTVRFKTIYYKKNVQASCLTTIGTLFNTSKFWSANVQ